MDKRKGISSSFIATAAELKRVLGRDYESTRHRDHPLGILLRDALDYDRAGVTPFRELTLLQIRMMLKHLGEVTDSSPKLGSKFRRQIYRSTDIDQYEALRFEIDIAASLARSATPFEKRESPDFAVDVPPGQAFIECTSVHLTTSQRAQVFYKLAGKLREKGAKPYATRSTALFIDGTSYLHRNVATRTKVLREDLKTRLDVELRETHLGSVLVWFHVYEQLSIQGVLQLTYVRQDHNAADRRLTAFLDRVYPVGEVIVRQYAVPAKG